MRQGKTGRKFESLALAATLIAAAFVFSSHAHAQDAPQLDGPQSSTDPAETEDGEPYVYATPADLANAPQQTTPEDLGPPVDDATLATALADPADVPAMSHKTKSLRMPRAATVSTDLNWDKTSNPNGSASYRVNKPLAAPWDAKIGADIDIAAPPATDFRSVATSSPSDQGVRRAWANVTVPDFATVEVQALPLPDRDSVGTKVQRSIPIGQQLSVTVQGTLGFSEQRVTVTTPTAATVLPGRNVSIFDSDKSLQLDIRSTGTTLLAGSTTATGDPIMHNRFSAAQKVYGPLTVTGTVNDVGQPTVNKSLTAGLKFDW